MSRCEYANQMTSATTSRHTITRSHVHPVNAAVAGSGYVASAMNSVTLPGSGVHVTEVSESCFATLLAVIGPANARVNLR